MNNITAKLSISLASILISSALLAQPGMQRRDPSAPFDLATDSWNARWISVPGTGAQKYGVYHFRKQVKLSAVPSDYVVHVSGDNRYKLYVNDSLVSMGPAKGDATHWSYETLDLAPWLREGENEIAALVYHEGGSKPDSQVSVAAGFLLQGEGNASGLFTDKSWECYKDEAYSPVPVHVPGYYVAGPGEKVDFAAGKENWQTAEEGPAGEPKNLNSSNQGEGHNLVPSPLPQMERKKQPLYGGFTVPAKSEKELLLDNKVLTNAYFNMVFNGGAGAEVSISYAEALYIPDPEWKAPSAEALAKVPEQYRSYALTPRTKGKGNRNETEGKVFLGREDVLLPDGAAHHWTSLSWRTYRYVRLHVVTKDEPLVVDEIYGDFTGYPFTWDASLDTDRKELRDIFETGWRTARLCAWETYMDCPYYEQLQYLGDSRIQALVSLYSSKDDRLVKRFLTLADMSRNVDGITKSRYPTTIPQYIQPYALSYIYALHDYMMYGADTKFVMDLLPGAEQIMGYLSRFQQEDGRLKNLPGWNFSDWVNGSPSWNYGAPLKGEDGCSINMDLQLLYAYQQMAQMEEVRGNTWQAGEYTKAAEKLAAGVKAAYWNPERGLFADRSEKDNYSQHGNALALLCGIVDDPKALAQKLLDDKTLNQCSLYYKFYLHQASVKAGLGDHYLEWLGLWRDNLAMGLTTWGEDADIYSTRSDCHAWGASPNIELFRTVLGIDSDAVAFARVKIEPHLGDLKEIGGTMPHPAGSISVHYKVRGGKLQAEIKLPEGVGGTFVWKGETRQLHGGKNSFVL